MSSSSVVAFPLYRRRNLVSAIARVFRSKQGEEANAFWRQTAKQLLSQLSASGVDVEAAEEEVRTLLYAVLDELHRSSAMADG